MGDQLFIVVVLFTLLVGVATLIVLVLALRSARRTQRASEDRIQLLQDQRARLESLREEDRLLAKQFERQQLLTADEEREAKRSESEELGRERAPEEEEEQEVAEPAIKPFVQTGGEPKATDAAKRKAEKLGVDLSQVEGSGADGRITVKDVVSAAIRG